MFVFVSICRHRQRECYSKQLKHFCASTFEPPTARCRSWSISWKNREYKQAYATIGSSSSSWRRKLLCNSMKNSKIDLRCGNFWSNMQIYSNRTHKSIVIRPGDEKRKAFDTKNANSGAHGWFACDSNYHRAQAQPSEMPLVGQG